MGTPVLIQGRHAGIITLYGVMLLFCIEESWELSPFIIQVAAERPNYLGLAIWDALIGVGATLATIGAWTAPAAPARHLSPVRPKLLEAFGCLLLFIAFSGFHVALLHSVGLRGAPTLQPFVLSWWAVAAATCLQAITEAVRVVRARRRGTATTLDVLRLPQPGG